MSKSAIAHRSGIFMAAMLGLLSVSFNTAHAAQSREGLSPRAQTLFQKAGNAARDDVRMAYLKDLRKELAGDSPLTGDLDKLVAQIDRWISERRLDYFGRDVSRSLDYDFGIPDSSPLYPLTYLYRGRMVIWYALESGGVWNQPDKRKVFFDKARSFFQKAADHFPENPIPGMYLGRPIPVKKRYAPVKDAPQWAVYQREGLERLADIIEWWIDNRMQGTGEYGGGWGDDCEMWRWWVPVLIGFDDPKITDAQARFSEALMSQSHMKTGYTTRMSDVEHTAEDSADVITPMMHIKADDPAWSARALRLAELMENLWTGRNERGFLQFKSTYFTADSIDDSSQRACDTVYHPRTVQPTLLYWQRTADKNLTSLFSAWMDTWVDAAARAERGKPAGIIPTAIHWPDGTVGGLGPDWWDPRNHGEYTLYLFPSAMSLMTHTLLLTHHMTGDDKYLDPIRSMAAARLRYLENPRGDLTPGSERWCASKLGGLSSVIAKYKFVTGKSDFDRLFEREMSPYMRFRLRGENEPLLSALEQTVQSMRINFEGYTSEVRYTDRVLRFPTLFGSNGLSEPTQPIHTPNPSLLYSTTTGDPGDALYFPLNAVRWLTPPRNIAALVTDSGPETFQAQLFHFGQEARPISAELYLLKPGRYRLILITKTGGNITTKRVSVTGPGTTIEFTLPARKTCTLRVSRIR